MGFLSEFLAQWWPGYQLDSGGIPLVLTHWQMLLPVFRKRVFISFKLKMRCFLPEDTTPRLKMNKCKAQKLYKNIRLLGACFLA